MITNFIDHIICPLEIFLTKYIKFIKYKGFIIKKIHHGFRRKDNEIEKIITNKESWNHDYIDDVALGGLLNGLNIIPTSAPRVDINSTDNDYFFINGQLISMDTIKNSFHFRCKTTIEKDRSKDIEIIKNLNKIQYN